MARRLLYLIDMDRIDTNHHLHLRWFIDYYISVDQLLSFDINDKKVHDTEDIPYRLKKSCIPSS